MRLSGRNGAVPENGPEATEPVPANAKVLRLGHRRVVASNPKQHQFGHFGIEMLYALAYARLFQLPVVFLRARSARRAVHALLEIDTDEVRVFRGAAARWAARFAWWLSEARGAPARQVRRIATIVRAGTSASLRKYVEAHPDLPKPVKAKLLAERKRLKRTATPESAQPLDERPSYNRRQLASKPVHTFLRPDAEARAESLARALGISPETKLVCLHVRERGYKFGDEMQDKAEDAWDDSVRNARIETHLPAIDYLVERGYTVFRMGDPTMTPIDRPGVIDHATSLQRDPTVDLWCLLRAKFIICGESGPYSVSFLTNTPLLSVNSTDPIGAFPIRPDGIYLLKTVIDRETGEEVLGAEHLTAKRLEGLRDPTKFEFRENTPEQVLDAVAEMLELLDDKIPESPAQRWFRELVTEAAQKFYYLPYVRKHGPDRGYMGYGRLARSQAEDWLARGKSPRGRAEERETALA